MNKNCLPVIQQQICSFYTELLEKMTKSCETENYNELLNCWQEIHNTYLAVSSDILQQWGEKYGQSNQKTTLPEKIQADWIVVEVMDQDTGKFFRRNLPLKYFENNNGLVLSGETPEGKPSQIAFLSRTAVNKINDLLGKGPDSPRCKD